MIVTKPATLTSIITHTNTDSNFTALEHTPKPPITITGTKTITSPTQMLKVVPAASIMPKLALYLPRLAPDTFKDNVLNFVRKHLDTEEITVYCLLRKDANPSTITFLSFKVLIPEQLCTKALSPETWPNGFTVCEFVDKRRQINRINFRSSQPSPPPIP